MFSKNSQGQGPFMEILMKCTIFDQEVLVIFFVQEIPWKHFFKNPDFLDKSSSQKNLNLKKYKKFTIFGTKIFKKNRRVLVLNTCKIHVLWSEEFFRHSWFRRTFFLSRGYWMNFLKDSQFLVIFFENPEF